MTHHRYTLAYKNTILFTAILLSIFQPGRILSQTILDSKISKEVKEANFFPSTKSDKYYFGVQLTPKSSYFLRLTGGLGYYEYDATTYAPVNKLDSTLDIQTQIAYSQAYWNISQFQAKVTQARLRREIGFPSAFMLGRMSANQAKEANIWRVNQEEWDEAVRLLQSETQRGEPLLTSLAFANEYEQALDTIKMPQLAYKPHGIWVYFGLGANNYLEQSSAFRGGVAIDLGLGYRYKKFRIGYAFGAHEHGVNNESILTPTLIDNRATWTSLSGLIGYDLWSNSRFAMTSHVHLGGGSLKTGFEEEQVILAKGFAPGLSLDFRARLGKPRDSDYYGGLKPRHPYTLFARVCAMQQKGYLSENILNASAVIGIYMDASMLTYVK